EEQSSKERNSEFIPNRYVEVIVWMPEPVTEKKVSLDPSHTLIRVQQSKELPPDRYINMYYGIHFCTAMIGDPKNGEICPRSTAKELIAFDESRYSRA